MNTRILQFSSGKCFHLSSFLIHLAGLTGLTIVFLLSSFAVFAQQSETAGEGTDENKKIKLIRKGETSTEGETSRRKQLEELRRYQKQQEGKNIFGDGIVGFTGGLSSGSLTNATEYGSSTATTADDIPSDTFAGSGLGLLFDLELAMGNVLNGGVKSAGKPWMWWGTRVQLDFLRRKDSIEGDADRTRVVSEILLAFHLKYFIPLNELPQTSSLPVVNRVRPFIGFGPMWSIGISDIIEDNTTRTFSTGPNASDFHLSLLIGANIKITKMMIFTLDYRLSFNRTSEYHDRLTGEVIKGTGSGGGINTLHLGIGYLF